MFVCLFDPFQQQLNAIQIREERGAEEDTVLAQHSHRLLVFIPGKFSYHACFHTRSSFKSMMMRDEQACRGH